MITHYPKDWIERASAHYCHAVEKHPHFADEVFDYRTLVNSKEMLSMWRSIVSEDERIQFVSANNLLMEEIYEIVEAVKDGDAAHAVEEIWDAVAVLMRMAVMVERGGASRSTTRRTRSGTTLSEAKEEE